MCCHLIPKQWVGLNAVIPTKQVGETDIQASICQLINGSRGRIWSLHLTTRLFCLGGAHLVVVGIPRKVFNGVEVRGRSLRGPRQVLNCTDDVQVRSGSWSWWWGGGWGVCLSHGKGPCNNYPGFPDFSHHRRICIYTRDGARNSMLKRQTFLLGLGWGHTLEGRRNQRDGFVLFIFWKRW